MLYEEVVTKLRSLSSEENQAGMARYGINTQNALGISLYVIRPLAKEMGTDHLLAQQLWDSGIHEARILASLVAEFAGGLPLNVKIAVAKLQPVFQESRYPSDDIDEPIPAEAIEAIAEEEARASVKWAEEIMAWVQTLLQQPPGGTEHKTSY